MSASTVKGVLNFFRQAPLKAPKGISGKGFYGISPEKGMKGLEEVAKATPSESLVMMPLTYVAEKAFGKKKVQDVLWKKFSKPLAQADIGAGRVLEKMPFGKKLFRQDVLVPVGKPEKGVYKKIQHSSALAPLVKAKNIAAPFIIAEGAEKGLRSLRDMKENNVRSSRYNEDKTSGIRKFSMKENALQEKQADQDLREKVASAMIQLVNERKDHEKRAQAIESLYKQVELGHAQMPRSYSEFTEKVASLMTEDLRVLDKALELLGSSEKLGDLADKADSAEPQTASQKFQDRILGED